MLEETIVTIKKYISTLVIMVSITERHEALPTNTNISTTRFFEIRALLVHAMNQHPFLVATRVEPTKIFFLYNAQQM